MKMTFEEIKIELQTGRARVLSTIHFKRLIDVVSAAEVVISHVPSIPFSPDPAFYVAIDNLAVAIEDLEKE